MRSRPLIGRAVLSIALLFLERAVLAHDPGLSTARIIEDRDGLKVTLKLAQKLGKGKIVVAIFADTGERYLTTDLFQTEEI